MEEDTLPSTLSPSRPRRVQRLCNSTVTTFNLPSLPKLHGSSTLVTTKLCEQVYKSVTPNMFDLSIPKKQITTTLLEYNSLQDPHLRSYFYHPPRKHKLKESGFVNQDLEVICSLKKYNAYRHFLEDEFMKIHQQKRRETEAKATTNQVTVDEREKKRKQFFQQQEKKLRSKQQRLRQLEQKEENARQSVVEQKRLLKEQAEMKREAELEEKKVTKIRKQYEESFRRKSLIDHAHTEEYLRLLQLHKMKQFERMKHDNELEERWEKYERHTILMEQEEERKKKEKEREKEKKLLERVKLFKILQKREEERKQKIHEENHNQVLLLHEEAEEFEKHWKKLHDEQVVECRGMMEKQKEHFHLTQRRSSVRPMLAYSSRPCSAAIPSRDSDDQDKKRAYRPSQSDEDGVQKQSSASVLGVIQEDISIVDNSIKIVVESVSNDCMVSEKLSSHQQDKMEEISQSVVLPESESNNSGIDTFSCEVLSSSSKTKAVRFDIPEQKVN